MLWKATDELVEEFFRRDLQVERVSAGLDEGIEECEREESDVLVPVVGEMGDRHRCFSWGIGLLRVNVLGYFEM